ncbi:MAG TPA: flagellar basal body rod protein FlgB [bacterium]|nr:flagellar basal body rod protein FlgB [bacterium]
MGIERFLFGDPAIASLQRSLDVQALRSELVAANLANVDTPGYKARDVDFTKVLATEEKRLDGSLSLETSDARHLSGSDGGSIPIEVQEDDKSNMRVDGNTVNQDKELQKLAEIQLLYEASITAITRKFTKLADVINNAKI